MHFCEVTARVYARRSSPVNTRLNGTMPAFANISVASPCGTSDPDATSACPRSAK